MNDASWFRHSAFLVLFLIVMPGPVGALLPAVAATSRPLSTPGYQAKSWAIGIVVPEGASLEGGGNLSWGNVKNVTALLTLPNITRPDLPVYSVLSVMTDDGSVLQAATGIYKNGPSWLVYADLVTKAKSVPPDYQQILNSSGPAMSPSTLVSISIFRSPSGLWSLRVVDVGAGSSVERAFPPGVAPSLKAGDQELFAVESYSRSQATFQNMGNLTLMALLVDGKRVTGGFYSHYGWDPTRSPLFVVGSEGTTPPYFILLRDGVDGSLVWRFETQWASDDAVYPGMGESLLPLLLLLASLLAVAFAITRSERPPVRLRRSGQ